MVDFQRALKLIFGYVYLCLLIPPTAVVIGSTVLWDAIDPITMRVAKWINKNTVWLGSKFTIYREDSFLFNCLILYAVAMPAFFFYQFYATYYYGFSLLRCYLYHVIRIGPYFMNFAYVYTLCHKEGHRPNGMWKENFSFFRFVFNWWVGLFYGVMPSSFHYGHSINHHKYTNSPKDVISTGDSPRDSVTNFIAYIYRFWSYAINLSTIQEFIQDKNYAYAFKMFYGTIWFWLFVGVIYFIHPVFAIGYLGYPLLENVGLLACINWSWHSFIDPKDPDNEYVASLTLLDGKVNVMNEDYHVVHHHYPARHWTENPALYKKHLQEYTDNYASIFKDTHAMEMFFLVILKEYNQLADKFVDLSGKLTREQKIELIKSRLHACSFGPLKNTEK